MSEHTDMLRAFADWLDEHPDADQTSTLYVDPQDIDGWRVIDARPNVAADMREYATKIGGRWVKSVDDNYFWLSQKILPGVHYRLYTHRNAVCTRRVVGTEEVEVPDPDAPLVTVTRDVIEWDCPDSLAALTAGEAVPS